MRVAESRQLDRTDEKMIEECFVMGKLAEDGPELPRLGDEFGKSVSYRDFNGNQVVVFYIQPLSREPEKLQTVLGKSGTEVYISFDDKNKRYLDRYGYSKEDDKVAFLKEHFKNRLILFRPILSYEHKALRYHYNFQILLDEKLDTQITLNSKFFVPLPTYSQHSHQMFESRLVSAKPIELSSYNHAMEIPEFIVCGDYLYYIVEEDSFKKYKVNQNHNLYICEKPEGIRRIKKPKDFERYIKLGHKDVAFAPIEETKKWIDECNEYGESIPDILKDRVRETTKETKKDTIKEDSKVNQDTSSFSQDEIIVNESDFVQRLDYLARKKKLRYALDDIYNFHTSLKTSNFTILGGMSGTGKTELAMLYSEALKMKMGENLLFIPVRPSFTEPSDLFGFLNPQTGVYHESEVGLVSFLYQASIDKNKMHMVLFDEMNLGQVEHYFSDFISILELEKGKRVLRLFNEGANCVQPHLRGGIPIGDNVLFVGTANFDETTRDFSNRMLDRSNVIILEKLSFLEAQKYELEDIDSLQDYEEKEKTKVNHPEAVITAKTFNSWISEKKSLSFLKEYELSLLDNLHEEISSYDSQTGVSFRIAKQIAHYLENVPKDEEGNLFIERTTAFDYQIKQRILSKIRGHKEQIENLVGNEDDYNGRLGIIISGDGVANFEKSLAYLKQKAKELKRNGYTL
ncbi:McrB family protein [Anaerobacillus isosaccharinicus]|uniref:AAA family ATPase n=1 Tax=Anaerobacillus isosaccharinicus TaxID=1532552 RepID=A0A1S2M321_9BACI|nr:AAA family ATPase [Anaerobacillus isosaccharinicus]MBA5584836.1 AAA family ATPase [Anaerobacillus isosaccharinicus]QOY36801.1 AAA family ATPase [Anaerobacillus isosaccharinicus]